MEGLKRDIECSVASMLGFRFAHLGINCGEHAKELYSSLLNLKPVSTGMSYFVGDVVEFLAENGRGKNGHIAIATCDIVRAIAYYGRKGIQVDQDSIRKNEKGDIFAAYLKDEVGGFAVHLLQK